MQHKNDSLGEKRSSLFMQWWDSLTNGQKIFWLFIFATVITAFYGFFLAPDTNNGVNSYNLHRNLAILFFGIFGGGLAVWARFRHEKQLKHTEEQIEISRESGRNDRFAKASEMLGNDKSLASQGGGLYMLLDLIREKPKKEYIRCAEIICYWLREKPEDSRLRALALEIFTGEAIKNLSNKTRRSLIAKYKNEHNRNLWPNLEGADLSNLIFSVVIDMQSAILNSVNFSRSNLKEANLRTACMALVNMAGTELENADFSGALIAGAKMKTAKGLTKEQILSATWKTDDRQGMPPELPDELIEDPEVQEWLKTPPFTYRAWG